MHFLNREIYRSIDIDIDDKDVLNALKIISITTNKLLSTSVAFVWESFYNLPYSSKFILDLLSEGRLCLMGSFYSNNDFITNNQHLYSHDYKRYEMYFNKIPKELRKYSPNIKKLKDTTCFLESELLSWCNTGKSSIIDNSEENKKLLETHETINKTLSQREGKAITASLFSNMSSKENLNQLSRNLSLLHLISYMREINADIITGYPNLDYYNTAAKTFPLYDIGIRAFLLRELGIDLNRNFRKLFSNVKQPEHSIFVNKLENIIEGTYFTTLSKTNSTIPNIICHKMKEIIIPALSFSNVSRDNSWINYNIKLDIIDKFLYNNEATYNELSAMRKEVVIMKDILLCTATNEETQKVIEVAKKTYGLHYKIRYIGDHSLYCFGSFRGVNINMVQSEMGTESPGGATLTVNDVCHELCPQYVISVGICYGLDEKKSRLGDVVVASQLQIYDLRKITGADEEVIPRGDNTSSSVILLDRFRSSSMTYDKRETIHFEKFITGNTLVNSISVVKKLKNTFKEAFAGDMEAGGIYSVCEKKKINWGIVKGISDWGFNKDNSYQDLARTNAISFVFYSIAQGGY